MNARALNWKRKASADDRTRNLRRPLLAEFPKIARPSDRTLLGRLDKFVSHRDLTEFFNTLLGSGIRQQMTEEHRP